jgi:hypothetical protein
LHAEKRLRAARKYFVMNGSGTGVICLFNALEARRRGWIWALRP